jgi:hypothetical protein
VIAQELRNAYDDVPFRPFVIRMNDGQEYPIRQRDHLLIAPTNRTAVVCLTHSEAFRIVDIPCISGLTIENPVLQERSMTSEHLRQTRDATPFRPFTIHMTDGRSYRVAHRDFLLVTTTGSIAVVHRVENDAIDILDVMLMASLSVDPSPAPAATSGTTVA